MLFLLTAAATALGCSAAQGGPAAPAAGQSAPAAMPCVQVGLNWRTFATEADRHRLRDWRKAWEEALAQAREAGHGGEIDAAGPLLDPDSALTEPMPPEGDYACRTIKIGSPPPGGLPFVDYPPFRCRVRRNGDHLEFIKLTGSQRPIGRLFDDESRRAIFLGTLQLGDERRTYQYGTDSERDLIAAVERVGDRQWRLVFPYPHFESLLDVIELTPVR